MIRRLLFHNTQLLEFWCGSTMALRAVWMLAALHIADDTRGYVFPPSIPVWLWALSQFGVGLTQAIMARGEKALVRGVVATAAAMELGFAASLYITTGNYGRAVVSLLSALVLQEMFIAFRAWQAVVVGRRLKSA